MQRACLQLLAPVQLLPQHVVVAVAEADAAGATGCAGSGARSPSRRSCRSKCELAVEVHARIVGMVHAGSRCAQSLLTTIGRLRQRVRADRHQRHRLQRRMQDRPAGRQRVRGGAGRRGDDQAVGALAVDELAVDAHFQLDQARRRALADHHVVEGAARRTRARPPRSGPGRRAACALR